MQKFTLRKALLVVVAVSSLGALTACTNSSPVYRNYYLDRSCSVYYVNDHGEKVYGGKYNRDDMLPLEWQQGADGRWYRQDSWGNRLYKSKYCK